MTLLTPTSEPPVADQARRLRELVAERSLTGRVPVERASRVCRSLAVVSGKGGVGKSVLSLNLGIALARHGSNVGLLDATQGAGSLGLLCGQNGYWNLEHVLAGARRLNEILLPGPCGIQIVPGASHFSAAAPASALRELTVFESVRDWIIADTGADLTQARRFAATADAVLVVTTPEPTSLAEAYATIKFLAAAGVTALSVLVNQADTQRQATQILERLRMAAREFLGSDIGLAGFVPFDPAVGQSVSLRISLAECEPSGSAQRALEEVGHRLTRTVSGGRRLSYFERLAGV
jgi:flagellar biosynthesis protein FlhG